MVYSLAYHFFNDRAACRGDRAGCLPPALSQPGAHRDRGAPAVLAAAGHDAPLHRPGAARAAQGRQPRRRRRSCSATDRRRRSVARPARSSGSSASCPTCSAPSSRCVIRKTSIRRRSAGSSDCPSTPSRVTCIAHCRRCAGNWRSTHEPRTRSETRAAPRVAGTRLRRARAAADRREAETPQSAPSRWRTAAASVTLAAAPRRLRHPSSRRASPRRAGQGAGAHWPCASPARKSAMRSRKCAPSDRNE